MKIAIFGAGAMGCLIGGKLAQAGADVSLIARGTHLQALQTHGLTLSSDQHQWQGNIAATNNPADIGPQDAVILCTKSHQVAQAALQLSPLFDEHTCLLSMINGLPWWYFQRYNGAYSAFEDRSLKSLDPKGDIATHIMPERIIGGANYLAATVTAPGTIHYVDHFTQSLVLGELDGHSTPRLEQLVQWLSKAGFDPVQTDDIRSAIWRKLWGNIAFNPVSALTHATMDAIAEDYDDTDLVMAIMNETRLIAEKLGIDMGESTRVRIAKAAKMKGHKTSMLTDIEHGRKTEIDAIVGAVREIGLWLEESTPHLNGLYSLVRLKEQFYAPHLPAQ